MKVLVAGASGAIGRSLVPQLIAAGHEVVGTTRSEDRAAALRDMGAQAVVVDMLDAASVKRTVESVHAEVIVDELTSLPQDYDLRRRDLYDANDEVRSKGTGALVEAARETGVRRYVVQSISFLCAPEGDWVKDETARPWTDAPPPFDRSIRVLLENERKVCEATEFEGLALRYGFFYGPGTYYASDGSIAQQVRTRRFPIGGKGESHTSFVHIDDAAAATKLAVERGAPGVYNIVDDDPARLRDWLPAYAQALGAKPPRRIPVWLIRLLTNRLLVTFATQMRASSNAKAKAELGWLPALPSWREGFRTALDRHVADAVDV